MNPQARALVLVLGLVLFPIVTPVSTSHAAAPIATRMQIVPPGWPKMMSIPRLGIRAAVESVSMTHPTDTKAPYKWGDVAWYSQGPRPGDIGRAEIFGHLDSYCCPAVFWHLKDLAAGDKVTVQYADGQSLTFTVQWNREYLDGSLPTGFMDAATKDRGLFLITCAGVFHRDGTGYDHRQVVYATLKTLPGGAALPSLTTPVGVAANGKGDVFIADAGNNRIASFDTRRRALHKWGTYGTETGQFRGLSGVAVAPNGTVYVADDGNHRIQVFSPTGQPLAQWGDTGSVKVSLDDPAGVAVDSQGNVYVANSSANQIVKLSPSGQVLDTWGHFGHDPGEFWYPDGVAVAPDGTVYVADSANGRIQKLSPSGDVLKMWKVKVKLKKHWEVVPPEGVAADRSGHVFVVSPKIDQLLRYSTSGKLTAKWGTKGSGLGQFRKPYGVAVDNHSDVYVADSENNRVQELTATGRPIRLWW
jgi:DNA-binding beta-propeller fold protein YncE